MEERIMTLHPDGKKGVNISREKYEMVSHAIIDALETDRELTFGELRTQVEDRLGGSFDGSIGWYYTTVKLDLEARGVIERLGSQSPQRIGLTHRQS